MIIFRLLGKGLAKLFRGLLNLTKYSSLIPVGIFIVGDFFLNWFRSKSFPFAFSITAKTLLSAELIINEKVHLAIANAKGYNLIDVFQILIALYILYALVRFFTKLQIKQAGSQAEWGAVMIAVAIVSIIEVSAVAVIDGKFGFIPIWDGVIFLLMNLQPVFTSIFGYAGTVAPIVVSNTTNVINSSIMSIILFFRTKDI
jgi:hypothetical protein